MSVSPEGKGSRLTKLPSRGQLPLSFSLHFHGERSSGRMVRGRTAGASLPPRGGDALRQNLKCTTTSEGQFF